MGSISDCKSAEDSFFVVMEMTGSSPEIDQQRHDQFLNMLMEKDLVVDAVLAQDGAQSKVHLPSPYHTPCVVNKLTLCSGCDEC